jgi:hypothetical protein
MTRSVCAVLASVGALATVWRGLRRIELPRDPGLARVQAAAAPVTPAGRAEVPVSRSPFPWWAEEGWDDLGFNAAGGTATPVDSAPHL